MIASAPSETFEATTVFASGLAGTLGVRIRDNQGADTLARTTASITADTTVGSNSVYRRSFTAPATAGQYTLVWDDGTNIATEELVVSASAATGSTGSIYATRAELKASLSATGTTYLDDDLDDALQAASRAIDEATSRRFYPTTETRYYTADRYRGRQTRILDIDDLNDLTTLEIDTTNDGTYETTWTDGTDFYLDPVNAALNGYPYTRVVLSQTAGRVFPGWDNAIKITGSFGWAATPPEVKQYTKIFAAQLLLRTRQAPFGVIVAGAEIGATAHISRSDPDYQRLLGELALPHRLIA